MIQGISLLGKTFRYSMGIGFEFATIMYIIAGSCLVTACCCLYMVFRFFHSDR